MIVAERFTLDTNILIYAVDRRAEARHEAASRLMQAAAGRDCPITVQVLGEFFHATTRKTLATGDQAVAYTNIWQRVFDVIAADLSTYNEATDHVRDHGMSFWDAMLWATARQAGCAFILSEDMQRGRRLGGVELVNPFDETASTIVGRLLGTPWP